MSEEGNKRNDNPIDLGDAFSSGGVTATGERVFVPLRKRSKLNDSDDSNGIQSYTDLHSISLLSDEEVKLIRLQSRISVEGDDVVGPILQFRNIGLHEVFLQKLHERGIRVLYLSPFHCRHRNPCKCRAFL